MPARPSWARLMVMIAAKDAILEGLSWVRTETLRTATEKAFGYASDLKVKLEHSKGPHFNRSLTVRSFRARCCSAHEVGQRISSSVVWPSHRTSRLLAREPPETETADTTNLRQLLQFLTLIWHGGAQLDDTFGQMMAPLLRGVVDWLSGDNTSCHDDWTHLRASCALVLSTSGMLARESPRTLVTSNSIWEMVLVEGGRPMDLVLACKNGIPHSHWG